MSQHFCVCLTLLFDLGQSVWNGISRLRTKFPVGLGFFYRKIPVGIFSRGHRQKWEQENNWERSLASNYLLAKLPVPLNIICIEFAVNFVIFVLVNFVIYCEFTDIFVNVKHILFQRNNGRISVSHHNSQCCIAKFHRKTLCESFIYRLD